MILPELRLDRFPPLSPEGMRQLNAAGDNRAINLGSLAGRLAGGGEDVGAAIKDGGDQAAHSIKLAGASLGDAGDQAGGSISSAAAAIVSAGQQAAEAIRAAGRDLMRPIGSLKSGRVNADRGHSGGDVQSSGGHQ